MMKRILIIDDNEDIRKIIGYDLIKAGFDVDDAQDGESGYQMIQKEKNYDLIIVDWMMPGMSGIELVRTLRRQHNNSLLFMLTAKDGVDDLAEAFEAGVDDYMRKPFSPQELTIRIQRHLQQRVREKDKHILSYGDITLDERSRQVTIQGNKVALTRKEFDMLAYYLSHPDTVLSRNQILNELWGFDYDGDTRIVDVHTFKLRAKLKDSSVMITSSRGIGYRLEKRGGL